MSAQVKAQLLIRECLLGSQHENVEQMTERMRLLSEHECEIEGFKCLCNKITQAWVKVRVREPFLNLNCVCVFVCVCIWLCVLVFGCVCVQFSKGFRLFLDQM